MAKFVERAALLTDRAAARVLGRVPPDAGPIETRRSAVAPIVGALKDCVAAHVVGELLADADVDLLPDDAVQRAVERLQRAEGTTKAGADAPTLEAAGDEWLPIDEAGRLAGLRLNKAGRCDVARQASKWKRDDPLPTKKINGTLRARVADCKAWKPKIEAASRTFCPNGTPNTPQRDCAAFPRQGAKRKGQK